MCVHLCVCVCACMCTFSPLFHPPCSSSPSAWSPASHPPVSPSLSPDEQLSARTKTIADFTSNTTTSAQNGHQCTWCINISQNHHHQHHQSINQPIQHPKDWSKLIPFVTMCKIFISCKKGLKLWFCVRIRDFLQSIHDIYNLIRARREPGSSGRKPARTLVPKNGFLNDQRHTCWSAWGSRKV